MAQRPILGKKGYLWVTGGLFLITLTGHWLFSWYVYVDEQKDHEQPVVVAEWFQESMKDTLENWQSEFLQLCWQVAGLAFLWYVGSPQSKESEDRLEEKIDRLLQKSYGDDKAKAIMLDIEAKYPKK